MSDIYLASDFEDLRAENNTCEPYLTDLPPSEVAAVIVISVLFISALTFLISLTAYTIYRAKEFKEQRTNLIRNAYILQDSFVEVQDEDERRDSDFLDPQNGDDSRYKVAPPTLRQNRSRTRLSHPIIEEPEDEDETGNGNRTGSSSPYRTMTSMVMSESGSHLGLPRQNSHAKVFRTSSQEIIEQMSRFVFTTEEVELFKRDSLAGDGATGKKKRKASADLLEYITSPKASLTGEEYGN